MTWPRLKIFAVTLILACAGGNFHTDVCKSPQVARMPAKLNVCTVTYTVFIQQHPASSETSVADKLAVIDARLRELAIGDDTESSKMFETILAPFNGKNGALGEKYSDSGLRGRGSIGFLEEKGKLTSTILKVTDVDVSSLVSGSSAGFKIATTWEDGPGFPYGQKSVASRVLMALKGNLLMEAEGGPKVLRVGSWFDVVSKKTFLAMELERVFPNSKSINSKDLWNRNSDFSSFDQPEISNQISKKMAQLFTETYEKEIIPDDAQFLITTDGRVSWVDGDQWFQIDHSNWNWDSFYAAVVMDFLTWSAKEPQFGKKVFEEILARIQKFPEAKRAAVLSELKSDMDHPVWVFRDRKDSERVRVPFREVLKIYGVETDPNSPKFPYRLTN